MDSPPTDNDITAIRVNRAELLLSDGFYNDASVELAKAGLLRLSDAVAKAAPPTEPCHG